MKAAYLYYRLRPAIPRSLQIAIRRSMALRRRRMLQGAWPVDRRAAIRPAGWRGWPDGKDFAVVLTHDVDTQYGHDRSLALAELEEKAGFRSLFNLVPERYAVSADVRGELHRRGFDVGVHGLYHDGLLFSSRRVFERRAVAINRYLKEWRAAGFRAPAMHHRYDWIGELDIEFDCSSFDVDPFEPQPDGVYTVFPFWIPRQDGRPPYLELPYTLPQDFALFAILRETSTRIWEEKLAWLAEQGGMVLLNTHPDYMQMPGDTSARDRYPAELYTDFLAHLAQTYEGRFWRGTPRELVAHFKEHPERLRMGLPRKIGMVAYTFYESDNRVMRYSEALASRGDVVDVVALRREGEAEQEFVKGVRVYRLQTRLRNETWKGAYAQRLLRFLMTARRFIARNHRFMPYDLLHVHNVPDFLVFAGAHAKRRGARIILDIHDILPEFYAGKFHSGEHAPAVRFLKMLERLSVGFADHVIISNHLWRETLLKRGVPGAKCTAILNYPDPAIFHPRPRTPRNGPFVFIYPGTLAWHQGIDVALRAMALARRDLPDTEFHVYGDGHERENLQRLAQELKVDDRVRFFGVLPLRDMAACVAQADAGVVPKRSDSFGNEAFSTKILEFMAMRIPVIAADTAIDRYYFSEGQLRFFRSGDAADLGRAMVELRGNPDVRNAMVAKAWDYVGQNSWDVKKAEYFALVDRLLGAP